MPSRSRSRSESPSSSGSSSSSEDERSTVSRHNNNDSEPADDRQTSSNAADIKEEPRSPGDEPAPRRGASSNVKRESDDDSSRRSSRKRSRSRSRSRDRHRSDRRDRDYDRDRRRRDDDRDRRSGRDHDRDRDYRRRRDDDRDRDRNDRNRDRNGRDERDTRKETAEPVVKPKEEPKVQPNRTGGVYIPPFKLARMQKDITDKSSQEYQKMTWDALKKSINGLINKVNVSNIKNIIPELFSENIIRGRGLFCRSLMKAQAASPNFTHIYAALVAVINTKFPQVGELVLKRLIVQFRRAFRRNIKQTCIASTKFIAHLLNQQVCGEVIGLQLLTLLLEKPSDDSVEVAIGFVRESGKMIQDLHPQGFNIIFERFRSILHEGDIDQRVQYMIEALFADRKNDFKEYPTVVEELDLVDAEDQITHEDIGLDEEEIDIEEKLNYFNFDPDYEINEMKYELLKKEILGDDEEDEDEDESGSDESSDEEEGGAAAGGAAGATQNIVDDTETELVNLRRTIYLTIMSSLDFEECGHKLLKLKNIEGKEIEICNMLIECCSQERTYLRFYGLLAQRFCVLNPIYEQHFQQSFVQQYSTIHRLETNKLRNVAKFFAHLLHTDAMNWEVLKYIRLNEQDTTSSSRIFIKILFQEMAEFMGLKTLNDRLCKDETMQEHFDGIMPKDNPRNTRFAINFFTSIGLGGLTDDLREHLRNAPKQIMQVPIKAESSDSDSSDSSDSDSDSDSDSSSGSDSDSSSDSSSESDASPRHKRSRR